MIPNFVFNNLAQIKRSSGYNALMEPATEIIFDKISCRIAHKSRFINKDGTQTREEFIDVLFPARARIAILSGDLVTLKNDQLTYEAIMVRPVLEFGRTIGYQAELKSL